MILAKIFTTILVLALVGVIVCTIKSDAYKCSYWDTVGTNLIYFVMPASLVALVVCWIWGL